MFNKTLQNKISINVYIVNDQEIKNKKNANNL